MPRDQGVVHRESGRRGFFMETGLKAGSWLGLSLRTVHVVRGGRRGRKAYQMALGQGSFTAISLAQHMCRELNQNNALAAPHDLSC